MAQAHERWIADIFADLSPDDRRALHTRLGAVKDRVRPPRSSS
jgi:hypothetical protein